ncbi:MFS transporter [Rothia sp. AR01]|uniref:MFS transporter n=1 Tax=Rothia santali TaxID=2949643 RepID=A0A9X2HD02_9MICC|nr:MFS transporter [Rothia santali]MCP3424592.1 MFS transporter [Rothia santali]
MPSSRDPRYLDALRLPGAAPTLGAALTGRAAYAMDVLPMLYAVSAATGSIGSAGLAVAAYGATAGVLAPVRARLIDRHGARPVLAVLTVLFGLSIAGLAAGSAWGASGVVLILLAAVIGACAPPLGPTMRVAWGRLAPDRELLRRGLSLDAVCEELLFLAGPALGGLALAVLPPEAVLLGLAGLAMLGGLGFAATPVVGRLGPAAAGASAVARPRSVLREPGFVRLLVPVLVAGGVSGALTVMVPLQLADSGGAGAAGVVLALFGVGSALGGLAYGAIRLPGGPFRQLTVSAALLVALSAPMGLVAGPVAAGALLAAAGLFFAPVLVAAYLAAHDAGGAGRENSASTWVNTAHNLGSSAATAAAGVLAESLGGPAAMACVTGVALALLVAAAARSGRARSE